MSELEDPEDDTQKSSDQFHRLVGVAFRGHSGPVTEEEWAEHVEQEGCPDTSECRHAWETVFKIRFICHEWLQGRRVDMTSEEKFASGHRFAEFMPDGQMQVVSGLPDEQDRDKYIESDASSSLKDFQRAACDALLALDYGFFRRMAKAVKGEAEGGKENESWEKVKDDPINVCYQKLHDFVKAHNKLPNAPELQELAGLSNSPDAWRRVNVALCLKGKLPRSNAL